LIYLICFTVYTFNSNLSKFCLIFRQLLNVMFTYGNGVTPHIDLRIFTVGKFCIVNYINDLILIYALMLCEYVKI